MAKRKKTKEELFRDGINPEAYDPQVRYGQESIPYTGQPTRLYNYDGKSDVNPGHRSQDDEYYACVKRSPATFSYWDIRFRSR